MARYHITIRDNDTGHVTYCAAKAVELAQDNHPELAALIALRAMVEKKGGTDD